MMPRILNLGRVTVSIIVFSALFFVTIFFSYQAMEKSLSNQIKSQLQNELHPNLFSDEYRKTDAKSMNFFINTFNEKSESNNIAVDNWLQLLTPNQIKILKIDDVTVKKLGSLELETLSPLKIKIEARGKERDVVIAYDIDYNFIPLTLMALLSFMLVYLFAFKRVPF